MKKNLEHYIDKIFYELHELKFEDSKSQREQIDNLESKNISLKQEIVYLKYKYGEISASEISEDTLMWCKCKNNEITEEEFHEYHRNTEIPF